MNKTIELEVNMRVFLAYASLLSVVIASGYLIVLVMRTAWFVRSAAVGADIVAFVTALCAAGLLTAILAMRLQTQPVWLPVAGLVLNGIVTIVYFVLYVIGKFGPVSPKL